MESQSNNFILTEKSSTSIVLKFWGYFWTWGAPKKAPFMYVEICPWVILFNPKLENEVLDDIQTYRFEKHGFSDSRARLQGMGILGASIWAPKSQEFYFHKLQKKLKIVQFYHVCSKCTSFDVQPHRVKWY